MDPLFDLCLAILVKSYQSANKINSTSLVLYLDLQVVDNFLNLSKLLIQYRNYYALKHWFDRNLDDVLSILQEMDTSFEFSLRFKG